jgi:3-hydroxybutyrate dehydrogenase
MGGIDILVNNAGVQHTAMVEDFPAEKWDLILALNLSAAFHLTRLSLPNMKKKNWGRIINIASVHGLVASVQKAAYVAAKHGLVGLTKVVALECAETGITCNAICPGWVLTPLVQKQIDDLAKNQGLTASAASDALLSEKQPSKRFTEIDQLGELSVFLCSNAASNLTGASIPVDGAWIAR